MKPERLYQRRFWMAIIVYTVLIMVSVQWLKTVENDLLRLGIAVLPIVPILFGMAAFLTYLRQMDEMQRRIEFEAFGFSLGLTGIVTFTLGLLENAGLPRFSLVWVFPMIMVFWGIGQVIAWRRYK
ncbi:MAG: hypothetical protein K8I30_12055, partial [Anaerolineae bacterium]|nr:hypothetical protein [Anaerolineae bacterium]